MLLMAYRLGAKFDDVRVGFSPAQRLFGVE